MPETVPDGTIFSWHDANEVDANLIFCNMMLHEIGENTTLHHSTFRIRERIEGMCVRLIEAISNLDKNREPSLFCNNIDLPSLDRIVHFDDFISLFFKVSAGNSFSIISCSAFGLIHMIVSMYYQCVFSRIPSIEDLDLHGQEHSRSLLSGSRTYPRYHSALLPSQVRRYFFHLRPCV